MKDWVYIENIGKHVGEKVKLRVWVYNKRSSGKVRFLLLRDGTGMIQGVISSVDKNDPLFQEFDELTQESSIIVEGKVREEVRAPGGYEIDIENIQIVSIAEEYPIALKEHGIAFLMEHRHLWIRSLKQNAILRIRATVIRSIREFFDERGFVLFDSPILTPSACEGTTTLFETQYFDQKAYLTQSGQLYAEAGAMALGKVYTFGPTFRAEKSKTRRHLMEFWMVEPEVAFAELNDVIELAEELVEHIVTRVLEKHMKDLEVIERDTEPLEKIKRPFPRITYSQAIKTLQDKGVKIEWGDELGGDEETVISEAFDKPVIITHYPSKIKAFYMQPDPSNPQLALCMDMIAPEGYGEIIGGSQRIHDLNLLLKRIEDAGLPKEAYEWYIDLRRYGTVPHSGFGLGLERTVAWICKLSHVREAVPFPRMLYKIYP
ncbi:MAG: asparagine--tRNA ligase [Candidatus Aminicenantia bacterium]